VHLFLNGCVGGGKKHDRANKLEFWQEKSSQS
jgi:hypothetical protein